MMRVAGMLFIFLLGYTALFLSLVWGAGITSWVSVNTPEVVVNAVSVTAHSIAFLAPACFGGALIGYCLSFYRGGSLKWPAIITGVLALLLLLYSFAVDFRSVPVAFCIAATLIGARRRKRSGSDGYIGKLLGDPSEEEANSLESQRRHIEYLTRAREEAEKRLNFRLAEDAIKELPAEVERHKAIFDLVLAEHEADKRLFNELIGELSKSELPDYVEEWRKHLYYGSQSISGARSNLATARQLIEVLEKTYKKEKYSVVARLAHMIRAELSDMSGNMEFAKPFERPES